MTDQPKLLNSILIVDDEKNLLLGISRVLQRSGYKVYMASSGNEGIELAHHHHPDIILSDIGMPPPNGFELRKILSESDDTVNIPFIFVTAKSSQEDKLHGLDLGADDYITKPFDVQELLARVQAVLRRVEKGRQAGKIEAEIKVDQLRKAISANMSHELRTPLGQIMMSLQTVMRQRSIENGLGDLDWSIQAALNSAERLKQLVNDLILLSTIDSGELSTFRQEIDPIYDIRAAVDKRIQSWNKGLVTEFEINPQIQIFAPRLEFTQMIIHLADNAAKFSPNDGKIITQVLPNGAGGCILTMSDEGPGIPPDLREKVFDRYFQADSSDARQYGGLGVGLTLCRAIARALGGNIHILESNIGCKVQLTLPPAPLDWKN
jgi:signal transduction histidine kinase